MTQLCLMDKMCTITSYLHHNSRTGLDIISSRIFVTLRYRDENPIVEKPGAVIIAN